MRTSKRQTIIIKQMVAHVPSVAHYTYIIVSNV